MLRGHWMIHGKEINMPFQMRVLFTIALSTLLVLPAVAATEETTNAASEQPPVESAAPMEAATVATPTAPEADEMLVEVNGKRLMLSEAKVEIQRQMGALGGQFDADEQDTITQQLYIQMADDFVTSALLEQEAAARKLAATEDEVNEAIHNIETNLPPGMSFQEALESQELDPDTVRKQIRDELVIKKLIDAEVGTDVKATEKEAAAFFESRKDSFNVPESVHARHILIATDPKDDDEVLKGKKEKAEAIRKELVEGADFEAVAAEKSDCPSKGRGGDLGTFERGQMVKPFEDAAFGQKVDEIGPVVETRFGYHIIQILEKTPASTPTFDEKKDELIEYLTYQKTADLAGKFIERLKEKATIVYGPKAKPAEEETEEEEELPAVENMD